MSLFCPRINPYSEERIKMDIDEATLDAIPPRRSLDLYRVTDRNTGKEYICQNAACDLPTCHCDAVIVKELT